MRSKRAHVAVVAVLTGATFVSSAGAGGGATAQQARKITTTLDGKRTLPHRIRWVARPGMAPSRVSKVEFLIDGKLRWVEQKAPYAYGDDSDWLVTSWLAPGIHRFTVRVTAVHGARASHTTTARVVASPAPPAELAGTVWRHVLAKQGELGSPPGTWTLRIDRVGWRIDPPNVDFKDARKGDSNLLDVAYLSAGLVELRGGIWTHPRSRKEGNGWCEDTNQAVRYRWSITGGQLTLALAGPRRCGDQATVLSRSPDPKAAPVTWTRQP
jgi:hypothetical protein